MSQGKAVTRATAARYRAASKGAKAVILDELCATIGWHRDHARKALRGALGPRRVASPPWSSCPRRSGSTILGIDSDNGIEFINHHLLAYCEDEQLTFTRSRSANKNDAAHVVQKNWSVVRNAVGYHRYGTADDLAVPNQIYALLRTETNYPSPQQKAPPSDTTAGRPTRAKSDEATTRPTRAS